MSPFEPGVAGSIIDPTHHTPVHEIDIDAVAKILVLIAMDGQVHGGAKIIPVRGPASVSGCIVGLSP
jgi:hypothetical protein